MPYTVTITERVQPGVPVLTLHVAGRALLFAKADPERNSHRGVDLEPAQVKSLRRDGYEVIDDSQPAPPVVADEPATPAPALAARGGKK